MSESEVWKDSGDERSDPLPEGSYECSLQPYCECPNECYGLHQFSYGESEHVKGFLPLVVDDVSDDATSRATTSNPHHDGLFAPDSEDDGEGAGKIIVKEDGVDDKDGSGEGKVDGLEVEDEALLPNLLQILDNHCGLEIEEEYSDTDGEGEIAPDSEEDSQE